MAVRAGRFDTPILIQTLTSTVDTMGAPVESWATATGAPTWAEYIPIRGIERIEAGKTGTGTEFKLKVRRWSILTTKHRVVFSGSNYDITGIEDNQRAAFMVLHCAVRE